MTRIIKIFCIPSFQFKITFDFIQLIIRIHSHNVTFIIVDIQSQILSLANFSETLRIVNNGKGIKHINENKVKDILVDIQGTNRSKFLFEIYTVLGYNIFCK